MFIVGTPVTGEDFIGREEDVSALTRYIKDDHNIAICGLPRIGKTSLVKEVIRRFQSLDDDSSPLFFEYTLTRNPENRSGFYQSLENYLETLIPEDNDELLAKLEKIRAKERKTYRSYIELYKRISSEEPRTLYIVIDELDYAHESLRGEIQNIRELGSQTDSIRLITISRHSLTSIFPLGSDGSNFPGIFNNPISLKGYSASDVALFKDTLYSVLRSSRPLEEGRWEKIWETIRYYCGNVPILLAIFASRLQDDIRDGPDIDYQSYISRSGQHYACLYYWFQSLCERKLMNQVRRFMDSGGQDAGPGDLAELGILEEKRFAIPYLNEFIQQISDVDSMELHGDYRSLSEDVRFIMDRASEIARELQGTDRSTYRELQKGIEELKAIRAKIEFIRTLDDLHSELVTPDVSLEELNRFKEYINRFSVKLEVLDK